MKIKPLAFFKAILGIFLFFIIQYIYQYTLLPIFRLNNYLINNLLLIIMELILVIVFALMNRDKLLKDYEDYNNNYKYYLKFGLKCWFTGLIFMVLSNAFINNTVGEIASNELSNRMLLGAYPIYSVFAMCLFGPFIEELVFRGNFKNAIDNDILFIIITALIFSGVHVFNGFSNIKDLLYFLPYGSMSIAFGVIYTKTNNIYSSIVMHMIHNTLCLIPVILLMVM